MLSNLERSRSGDRLVHVLSRSEAQTVLVLDGPYADEKTPLGNAGIEYEYVYEYDGNEAGAEGDRQIGLRVEDLALACPVPCRAA